MGPITQISNVFKMIKTTDRTINKQTTTNMDCDQYHSFTIHCTLYTVDNSIYSIYDAMCPMVELSLFTLFTLVVNQQTGYLQTVFFQSAITTDLTEEHLCHIDVGFRLATTKRGEMGLQVTPKLPYSIRMFLQ